MKCKQYISLFLKSATVTSLLACLLVCPDDALGAHKYLEYRVKAAFLYNFAKFVEWPDQEKADPCLPIIIGILGDDPFGPELDTIRKKTINSHHITIKHFDKSEDITGCHLLFISHTGLDEIRKALQKTNSRPVLTIGETEGFARSGGVIGFIEQQNKIRFEINRAAAARAGLTISSKLLKLAVIIETEEGSRLP
jgi:hypothetical protein